MEKDREATEKRLLRAVGEIIEESGLEFLKVNAVADKAGVSKMLIYRYFGSLEQLIARYIASHDYWINIPRELPGREGLNAYLKKLFAEQIRRMRSDKLLIRLHRWELSTNNELVAEIRKKREENGMRLVDFVSRIAGIPQEEVQVIASLITASVTYLTMFADVCDIYNGLPIQKEEGWKRMEDGINILIDKWI